MSVLKSVKVAKSDIFPFFERSEHNCGKSKHVSCRPLVVHLCDARAAAHVKLVTYE